MEVHKILSSHFAFWPEGVLHIMFALSYIGINKLRKEIKEETNQRNIMTL